jgi:hypothetical protein
MVVIRVGFVTTILKNKINLRPQFFPHKLTTVRTPATNLTN